MTRTPAEREGGRAVTPAAQLAEMPAADAEAPLVVTAEYFNQLLTGSDLSGPSPSFAEALSWTEEVTIR